MIKLKKRTSEELFNLFKERLNKITQLNEENLFLVNLPMLSSEYWPKVCEILISKGAIAKKDLVIGETYIGDCRNTREAVWLGNKFEYQRQKFGYTFPETINHFEDDDGFDLFIPIKIKE